MANTGEDLVAAVEGFESRFHDCSLADLHTTVHEVGGTIPDGFVYQNHGERCVGCLGSVGIMGGSVGMRSGACEWQQGAELRYGPIANPMQ